MTKLSSLRRLSREDLQGAPEWVEQLLQASNEFQEQATSSLGRDLLVGTTETFELKHATERIVKNPYGDGLDGVSAVRCIGLNVDSSGKLTGTTYALAHPRLSWRHIQARPGEDARIGVTAYYAPPDGLAILRYDAATAFMTNAANTPVPWDTNEVVRGALSHSTSSNQSRIVCAESGVVSVDYSLSIEGNVGVYHFYSWIAPSGASGRRYGLENRVADMGGFDEEWQSGAATFPVTAGDYIEVLVYQDTGGARAVGSTNNKPKMSVRYVDPPISTTGRVTLRFDGGN